VRTLFSGEEPVSPHDYLVLALARAGPAEYVLKSPKLVFSFLKRNDEATAIG